MLACLKFESFKFLFLRGGGNCGGPPNKYLNYVKYCIVVNQYSFLRCGTCCRSRSSQAAGGQVRFGRVPVNQGRRDHGSGDTHECWIPR